MEHSKLNITQISPGLISIPPNGWGAIEKIIWNYKLQLEKLNHDVNIKYINHIDHSQDILHIHVANLAIEAAKLGIPYIFSLHDHHVVHYGIESHNYKINLEAIKKSIISITHAEYLIDHFPDTDKLFYLPHGVDTEFFKSDNRNKPDHKLLCLANNGLAGDSSFDRKGFLFAIDAARELNLPITVAGPIDNIEFFKHYPSHANYEKLTLRCDSPTEDEILELYRDHTIFLHPSMLEAGHPNLTLLEALSCELPVVGTYNGTKKIDGLFVTDRDVKSIVDSIQYVMNNYIDITKKIKHSIKQHDWSRIVERLDGMYQSIKSIKTNVINQEAKQAYIKAYDTTDKKYVEPIENLEIFTHFVDGPFLEVKGNSDKKYRVQFVDDNGLVHYEDTIGCNMWVRLNRKYFTKWRVNIYEGSTLVHTKILNFENQRVLIGLDSKSLGDTLAWFPYIEEFKNKHRCKIIASTFHNDFFKNSYPDIEFVEPGTVVHNIIAKYEIGWFYDNNKEPELPNTIPLQKTATNILGLPYRELIPNIDFVPKQRPYNEKYVAIATASTAGLKYWTKEGWQEVINYLKSEGYRVIHISKEGTDLQVEQLSDTSMQNTMNVLYHAEFLIGLSSGLSWLAWAMRKKVVMISNFTEADHEFQTDCIRITNTQVCHGCWNKSEFTFDKGDWNWCPKHKNTDRHFECHRSIKAQTVIDKIKIIL